MHIFVVGGGASGISTAILLARYGCRVTLCEAGRRLAPLLRGFTRQGYHFDTGLHCVGTLGKGETLWRYFAMLGVLSELKLKPMRPDCVEIFRFADGDLCLPGGLDATAEALGKLWPEHAAGICSFITRLRESFLNSPLTNPENTSSNFAVLDTGESAMALLDSFGFPLRLKSLLMAHTVFMGTQPKVASIADYALVSYAMSEGMHTISGGGAALVAAFEKALAAHGVDVLTGTAAEKINMSQGAVTSVTLADGRSFDCDAAVYTGHPRLLSAMLPEDTLRPSMARHMAEVKDTEPCINLYGVSASDFVDGSFAYICGSDDLSDAFTAKADEKIWLTLSGGGPGPDGRRSIMVNMNLPGGLCAVMGDDSPKTPGGKGRPAAYAACKEEYVSRAVARLRERCPELADFELLGASTDYSMREWVYGSTGSIYGVLHSLEQMPVLPRTKVPNLVLAGQGVILPGLLGALVSGAIAAGMLVGFDKIFEDFRNVQA